MQAMKIKIALSGALAITGMLGIQTVSAQTATSPWLTGTAELGYVSTSGNSESNNINAKLSLARETKSWLHSLKLAGIGASSEVSNNGVSNSQRSAEKYNFEYQADRKLDETKSLYAFANYEKDRFSGFDEQSAVGVGYGHKVLNKLTQQMQIDIGPAYRVNNPVQGSSESEVVLHVGENYFWDFSETAKLEQFLVIDAGNDNTISRLGLSDTAKLTGALALKLATEWKLTDNPGFNAGGGEFEDLDSVTTANISYSF